MSSHVSKLSNRNKFATAYGQPQSKLLSLLVFCNTGRGLIKYDMVIAPLCGINWYVIRVYRPDFGAFILIFILTDLKGVLFLPLAWKCATCSQLDCN